MRVYPEPLEIGDEEGFSTGKDIFGRKQLADGMSHLVATVEDPLVIAFDGQWGSGKTTFLKLWAGELRKNGYPVIFFDAFENDYIDDAFGALAREIVSIADEKAEPESGVAESFKEKAKHLGGVLLRGAAKVGVKAVVRVATGGLATGDEFKEIIKDAGGEVEDIAETYMEQILSRPKIQKEIIEKFRGALAELPGLICPPKIGEVQKPLIFIIDELDRCKPLFALSILERIKHFMSVRNVHYVLGVHLEQLQGSVRYAYGESINASAYLQKFINIVVVNSVDNEYESQSDLHRYARHLVDRLGVRERKDRSLEAAVEVVVRILKHEQMSYRTLERAFTTIALSLSLTPENRLLVSQIAGGLVAMKLLRLDLFKKAKMGTLELSEALEFLRISGKEQKKHKLEWEEKWWTYVLSEEISEDLNEYGRSVSFNYSIRRQDIIKYMANEVIDRIGPVR